MENLSTFQCCGFSKAGRCYGVLLRVRGQAHVFGITQRGIFYRFGAKINEYKPGRWEAMFGVRTRIGIAELMIKRWMKNESVTVRFIPHRIRGGFTFSRTGIITFLGGSLAPSASSTATQQYLPDNYQTDEGDDNNSY